MDFELKIKNIGKIEDAKIRIGQLTVLAGPNNTGKSHVSKLLYSFFNAMNANPVKAYLINVIDPFFTRLKLLEFHTAPASDRKSGPLSPLREKTDELRKLIEDYQFEAPESIEGILKTLSEKVKDIRKELSDIHLSSETQKDEHKVGEPPLNELGEALKKDLEESLKELEEVFNVSDIDDFSNFGIGYMIKRNLIRNFQVQNLSVLIRRKNEQHDVESEVDAGKFWRFYFSDGNVRFRINSAWYQEMQQHSNVIYLESPLYWKLKNALERIGTRSIHSPHKRDRLRGVPEYFYDLVRELRNEYVGDVAFPDLYKHLTEEMGGEIMISESGDLFFRENGHDFPLSVTAMGIANLGILALLIKRQVIDKNSLIFIDEPEAHLHPAWQVVMADTLFQLAKGGARIVIATHSPDILKWLEVHVKNNPDDKKLIALNKFPSHTSDGEQGFSEKLEAIQQGLADPFFDLYMRGL